MARMTQGERDGNQKVSWGVIVVAPVRRTKLKLGWAVSLLDVMGGKKGQSLSLSDRLL